MKFDRVLFVSPPTTSYLGAARPPQNLGYLAKAIRENGINYDVLDMRLGYKLKHLLKHIISFKPDLIGITLVSLQYKKTYELISEIKTVYPHIKIVVGGPHVTALQDKVLKDCRFIDYGVVYEGEKTLTELCQKENETEISGLLRREDDQIIFNGQRVFNNNLDDISFPTYENFELHKYVTEIPLNTSRGCPGQCIFCPNRLITKKFRARSAQNVVNEMEYWYDLGIRRFNIDDDNFALLEKRVYQICDEIEKRHLTDCGIRCSNGVRADTINRNMLVRMREVGFFEIGIGVDGGNNNILNNLKKGEDIETIESTIKNACSLGFDVKLFFLIGSPQESIKDIEDSLRLVQKYPILRANLNNPIPYPGTELYEIVQKNKWFLKSPEDYLNDVSENIHIPVFETPGLSGQERVQILKRCTKIEKKITREAVRRIYRKYFLAGNLAGLLFASNFVQRMFFKNLFFRRIVERQRYRKLQIYRNAI